MKCREHQFAGVRDFWNSRGLLANPDFVIRMSRSCWNLVDGHGTSRVVTLLTEAGVLSD